MKKLYANYLVGLVLVIGIAIGMWWLFYAPTPAAGKYDGFAQCLANKGFTMYGAAWCSHCQNEKRAFGDSFRFVPYVECPNNPEVCTAKNVEGYPTWITTDGRRFVGEQGLQKLSEESTCALPAQ